MSNAKNYAQRIIRDRTICGGEPVFKGTRVTLRTVLASLAAGDELRVVGSNGSASGTYTVVPAS